MVKIQKMIPVTDAVHLAVKVRSAQEKITMSEVIKKLLRAKSNG
jgi:hypothetical protein